MSKATTKTAGRGARKLGGSGRATGKRDRRTAQFRPGEARFAAVMEAAERSGLLDEKSSRIAARVSPALVEQAKKRTGIEADTDLIAFALANVALEDNFAEAFKEARGRVDGGLKLGF